MTTAKQVDFLLAGYRHPTTNRPLSGGKVETFLDGTSTLSALWTDSNKSGDATNPIILDSSGKAEVYGDNIYKFRIYDSSDIFIEEITGLEYQNVLKTKNEFATISDLRAVTGTVQNETAKALGYYNVGDGGGGPDRYWSEGQPAGTYVDNGGSIIVPTGGDGSAAWLWSYRGVVESAWYGLVNSDTVDQTALLQNFLTSEGGNKLFINKGTILRTEAVTIQSGTTIDGVFGKSRILASATYTGSDRADGAMFRNENYYATTLTDQDIKVKNIVFDYRDAPVTGQRVGVFCRYVENVKVESCIQYGGEDLSGMQHCFNTEVNGNICYEAENSPYDHWATSGNIVVTNNIAVNATTPYNQGIQITADDTNPLTGALLGTGDSYQIIVSGNSIDSIVDVSNSGIILNCLTDGPTIENAIISDNYINGSKYGIVAQGRVLDCKIDNNIINNVTTQGILATTLFSASTTTYPKDITISNNTIKNSIGVGIDILECDGGSIHGNTITGGGYSYGIFLRSNSSDCEAHGNRVIDGTLGDILNTGTNNIVSRPLTISSYYNDNAIYNAIPPGAFTDLDISSSIGAKRALCWIRVINQTGSAAKFFFRPNGDTLTAGSLNIADEGTSICNVQQGQAQYILVATDENGILEWASSVVSGTVLLALTSYTYLEAD